MAAVNDVCQGNSRLMGESLADFGSWVGGGVAVGPALGGLVLSYTGGSDRAVHAFRAVFSLLHAIWVAKYLDETNVT